jgi:carbon monoxide dehydrogenase subunit G
VTVVVYSRDDCPYCDIVKRDHVAPLLKDARYRDRVEIREIRQDQSTALIDFSGKQTTHAQFARDAAMEFSGNRSGKVAQAGHAEMVDVRGQLIAQVGVGFVDDRGGALRQRLGNELPAIGL